MKAARGVRGDIQALRAFAVMAVVLYHLWPMHVPGGYIGVDAFFVISGFLITSHLLREVDRTAKIDLAQFWARRVRRLLPASLVVVVVSAVAVIAVVPRELWQTFLQDTIAATVYVLNWALAAQAVDYLAAENAASPVQHYWSLSVEEQFYLVWPLLIVGAMWLAARAGKSRRSMIFAVLAVTTVASLIYGIVLTATDPAAAYFVTPTRAWQFGAGALLAFVSTTLANRGGLSAIVSWTGVAALVVSTFAYGSGTPFPGVAALLPVAGVLLVVAAGESNHRLAPTRLYNLAPVRWLGDNSYSIYLWHWPPIVILPFVLGGELDYRHKLVILVATLVLAWLTKLYVEDPVRRTPVLAARRPRVTYAVLAGTTALALAAPVIGVSVINAQERESEQLAEQAIGTECFGAAAIQPDGSICSPDSVTEIVPEPAVAKEDLPPVYTDECRVQPEGEGVLECVLGDPDGEHSIAMVGDSHLAQWATPVSEIAKANGWRITLYFKGACPFTAAVEDLESNFEEATCITWNDEVLDRILTGGFDGVLTSSRAGYLFVDEGGDPDRGVAVGGFRDRWAELTAAGLPVAVLADTPRMPNDARECVTTSSDTASCGVDRAEAFSLPDYFHEAARGADDVTLADLGDRFCTDDRCPAVVGSVFVYRDGSSHVTDTFAKTLQPALERQLRPFTAAVGG
ncbi:Peptidoglycan/LPS O-acetylase OafA/YrhL, contains acyltransferase and SGNH-hydrolase domains [Promicromonospora umidemergens]|uniref:Acyltransferase family protein n=1 Tax=Promicromonospora umidemergens TaxID=629679 RepID=A0ABP8YCD5_9MICO|nr:acyltransferase family protein [Promicromonospora umidemergens]MCP2284647.1 Peptidoglycan/LPS O-acetylase OafA/YrhL, contains acyltransferase and SGNH-hydrolase domains [Promicromonospora umidemergens]